jgi:hypothetical protein
MKFAKNKTMAISIAIILTLSMTASMILIPNANAHTPPWSIPTHPYIMAIPNPVGVGQPVSVSMWVDYVLPSVYPDNDIRRHDYKLTITAPDGTKDVKQFPVVSDSTGIQFYQFTPNQVGNYTLLFEYPGQTFTWGPNTLHIGSAYVYQNDTYQPGSRSTTVIVQQEALPAPITSYPLPTEYWTRPIEAQNTNWWSISSNWLSGAYIQQRTQPYGTAPNSPHIMWTKPIDTGGVVGGMYGDIQGEGFYMGRSYMARFSNPIVMNGILYYQLPLGNSGSGGGYMAVDLRTGEELWYNDQMGVSGSGVPVPSFGYYMDINDMNQHGVIPQGLLFSSSYAQAFNPVTGQWMYNVTNVPSGTEVTDTMGDILRIAVTNIGTTANPNWRLTEWNSSKLWASWEYSAATPTSGVSLNASLTNPYTYGTFYASSNEWNVSVALKPGTWSISKADFDNIALLTQGDLGSGTSQTGMNITAVSLNPATRGNILWTKYYSPAPNNVTRSIATAWDPKVGVFTTYDRETMERDGWSLNDGSHLWTTVPDAPDYSYFDWFFTGFSAYGNYYYSGYDGVLHCWDMKTGNLLWTYGNGGVPGNTTFDVQQSWGLRPMMIQVIADGKIYISGDEHSPNTPLYKDDTVRCINATNGKEIWTMTGWICGTGGGGQPQNSFVADGYLGYINMYDMQIYVVGKGPSAMTVTAPDIAATLGSSVVIKGTVLDVSAGTKQNEQAADFPYGVPAVSDASQAAWMEYVYMQKPRPTNATGVPVSIDVIDSNGNYRNIGNTTSDTSGAFSFQWYPDIPGKYTVIATFAGSESYWPSYSETSFAVDPAAPTASPYPVVNLPPTEMYIAAAAAAIIVAIAIGFAITILMLRKRP